MFRARAIRRTYLFFCVLPTAPQFARFTEQEFPAMLTMSSICLLAFVNNRREKEFYQSLNDTSETEGRIHSAQVNNIFSFLIILNYNKKLKIQNILFLQRNKNVR